MTMAPFDPNAFLQQGSAQPAAPQAGQQPVQTLTGQAPAQPFDPDKFLANSSGAQPAGPVHPMNDTRPGSPAVTTANKVGGQQFGSLVTGDSPAASAWAFMHHAVHSATFGLSDWGSAALMWGLSHVMHNGKPMSIGDAHRLMMQELSAESENHPYSSVAGTVGGMFAGGAAAVKAAGKYGAKLGLEGLTDFEKGSYLSNVAKMTKIGAATGAVQGAVQGAADGMASLRWRLPSGSPGSRGSMRSPAIPTGSTAPRTMPAPSSDRTAWRGPRLSVCGRG